MEAGRAVSPATIMRRVVGAAGLLLRLLRVRKDAEDTVGGADNAKIKAIVSIHAPLPYILALIVFLGAERRVAEILKERALAAR